METSIYALIDPRTNLVRYVGKSQNPATRLRRHIHEANKGNTTHKCCWIASLLHLNLKPILSILEVCEHAVWKEREIYWIAFYRELGADLTNCKDGGDGIEPTPEVRAKMSAARKGKVPANKNKRASEETRAKLSAAAKARHERDREYCLANVQKMWMAHAEKSRGKPGRKKSDEEKAKISASLIGNTRTRGHKYTEEQRAKMSEAHKGKHNFTEEQRAKISAAHKGRKHSDESRRKMSEAQRNRAKQRSPDDSSLNLFSES